MLVHKALVAQELTPEEEAVTPNIITAVQTDTGFTLQCSSLSLYWQFNLNLVEYGNDILYLCQNRARQWMVVWATDLHESRDSFSAAMLRKNIDEFRPVAMIGINEDKSDYTALLFTYSREPNNPNPLVDEARESGDMTMKRLMPSIEPLLQRHWAKHKLLKDTKTNDSLAALEAQVDLLTHWLVTLLPIPAEKLQRLLDASVLTLKDDDVVLDDVVKFKTALRERQARYLSVLNQ